MGKFGVRTDQASKIALIAMLLTYYLLSFGVPGAKAGGSLSVEQAAGAQQLVDSILGAGIEADNITMTGAPEAFGLFAGGADTVGFDEGIVLSTGKATDVVGPNDAGDTTTRYNRAGDDDLTDLAGMGTKDAAILEFDFVPTGSAISFQYVFSSEEYNEYANENVNDTFAFFVNGTNVALIPNTATPVSINTVNGGNPFGTNPKNPEYFINNDMGDNGIGLDIEMDGLTVVMSVSVEVNPGVPNQIKLAIADGYDDQYDSNVFIKAGSLNDRPAQPGEIEITEKEDQDDRIDIYVNRRGGSDGSVQVTWTAKDDEGDVLETGTITFKDGETGKTVNVPGTTKTVELSDPTGGATIDPDSEVKDVDDIPPAGGVPSAPPTADDIRANATKDEVVVDNVPAGATVKVYTEDGKTLLGAAANNGTEAGAVTVVIEDGLASGEIVKVTLTEPDKRESAAAAAAARQEKTAAPLPEDVVANATTDEVTVYRVAAGTAVTVYGEVYGTGYAVIDTSVNTGGEPATVTLSVYGLDYGDNLDVTLTDIDKEESDKLTVTAVLDPSAAPSASDSRANATTGEITVGSVPPGATVRLYAEDGVTVLAAWTNPDDEPGTFRFEYRPMSAGDVFWVSFTERNKDESGKLKLTADQDASDGIDPNAVLANATDNRVTVRDVPAGGTIIVYDDKGNELGRATNGGLEPAVVTIANLTPPLRAGQKVRLTVTIAERGESEPVEATAVAESAKPEAADVSADVLGDTVTVANVLPGTTIIVYDAAGNELGRAANGSTAGPVTVKVAQGLEDGDTLRITATEPGKLESDPLDVVAGVTDDQALNEAARLLRIGFSEGDTWESVTSSLFLLTAGAYGTDVSWSSNKPGIVEIPASAEHTITAAVHRQAGDESVVLTATISKNGKQLKRTFLLIVKPVGVTKEEKGNTRQVEVRDQNNAFTHAPVSRIDVKYADGSIAKIDKVVLTQELAADVVANAGSEGNVSTIYIDELPGDEADEYAVEVPNGAVNLLASSRYGLNVRTEYGTITLDEDVLRTMNGNSLDLFFRLVPVKDRNEQAAIAGAIPSRYNAIGQPLEVETNYSGYRTALFIPFAKNGIDPNRIQPDRLSVYIEHSDGEIEIQRGELVRDENGAAIGLLVTVDKFSTFTIVEERRTSGGGGNRSSSSETVKAVVNAGDKGVGIDVSAVRTTLPDGSKKDELTVTDGKTAEAVDQAIANGKSEIAVSIPDDNGAVSETNVTVEREAAQRLSRHSIDLLVTTKYGSVRLPAASLGEAQEDVTVQLVKVRDRAAQSAMQERIGSNADVEAGAGGRSVELIGTPVRVTASVKPVTVIVPIDGVPAEAEERAAFAARLGAYVESDGSARLAAGRLVELGGGSYGFAVDISGEATVALVEFAALEAGGSHAAYIQGYPDGSFQPERAVTRAELAALMARNVRPSGVPAEPGASFGDVTTAHWAAAYIETAKAAGLMVGDPDGSFRPDAVVTRAELAQMAVRFKELAYDGKRRNSAAFPDVANHWAAGAIDAAEAAELMKGYAEGDFRPDRALTRAEAVAAINRLFGRGPLYGVTTPSWSDVPAAHWAYADIEEAGRDHRYTVRPEGGEQWTGDKAK